MRPGVAFEETEREEKVRGQYTCLSGRGGLLELGTGIKLSNESRTAQRGWTVGSTDLIGGMEDCSWCFVPVMEKRLWD